MSFQYLIAITVIVFSPLSSFASEPQTLSDPQKLGAFTWVPDGKRLRELPPQCSTTRLEKIIRIAPSPFERSKAITLYFNECEKFLTLMGESGITSMLQLFSTDYEYQSNPLVKTISIRLKDNTVIHGVLALKPDTAPLR